MVLTLVPYIHESVCFQGFYPLHSYPIQRVFVMGAWSGCDGAVSEFYCGRSMGWVYHSVAGGILEFLFALEILCLVFVRRNIR